MKNSKKNSKTKFAETLYLVKTITRKAVFTIFLTIKFSKSFSLLLNSKKFSKSFSKSRLQKLSIIELLIMQKLRVS